MILSKNDIQFISTYFSGKPVFRAFIFGSYSRGDATNDSDIDILVELDYSQHIGLSFISMKFDLEEKLHKKIDLVPSDSVSKYLLPFIEKDKKLIYERQNW